MEEKHLVTLSKYATTHRMSLHQVVKKVRSGELESVVKNEGGNETVYVLDGPKEEAKTPKTAMKEEVVTDYKAAYEALLEEHDALKAKYEALAGTKPRHAPYRPRGRS